VRSPAARIRSKRKRREREEATTKAFSALAERYLTEHARRFKRSWETDERNLRLHVLSVWKDRRYDEIERRDVIALSERLISQGKPILANRVQALVSSMFSFAVDADLVRANPCTRLRKRSQERVRRRVLSDDELRLFWTRIIKSPVSRQLGLALRLILLTGVRAGEMAGARREEFRNLDDPNRAAWLIPPQRTKNGRGHFVPLSELARVTVLDILSDVDPADERLLPSPFVTGASITPHALAVAMSRFAEALGERDAEESWRASPPTPMISAARLRPAQPNLESRARTSGLS
jgi:integrase